MDADGKNLRALSLHETNEWHPSVLHDGRIVYCRWDYVDRSAANYHGLWTTRPDGTQAEMLFGNYTARICACFQPYAIPGSQTDPFRRRRTPCRRGRQPGVCSIRRARRDERSGEERFEALEVLTPEVCFPEGNGQDGGWPKATSTPLSRYRRTTTWSVSATAPFQA